MRRTRMSGQDDERPDPFGDCGAATYAEGRFDSYLLSLVGTRIAWEEATETEIAGLCGDVRRIW